VSFYDWDQKFFRDGYCFGFVGGNIGFGCIFGRKIVNGIVERFVVRDAGY